MKSSRSREIGKSDLDDTQEVKVNPDLSRMDTAELQKLPSGRLFAQIDATLEPSKYFISKTQKVVNIMIRLLGDLDQEMPRLRDSNRIYRNEFNRLLSIAAQGIFRKAFKEKLDVCINVVKNLQKIALPGTCNERLGAALRTLEEEIKSKI